MEISIASPPDREKLVADILIENEQIAEINCEDNEVKIEIYPKQNGQPWVLNYQEFYKTIEQAKVRLLERQD